MSKQDEGGQQQERTARCASLSLSLSLSLSPFRLHQSAATLTAVHNLRQFTSDQINIFHFLLIKHNDALRILLSSSNNDDDYIQQSEIGGSCSMRGKGV